MVAVETVDASEVVRELREEVERLQAVVSQQTTQLAMIHALSATVEDAVELLKPVFETLQVGVVLFDDSAEIIWVNDRATEMLGRTVDEAVARGRQAETWSVVDVSGKPFTLDAARPVPTCLRTNQTAQATIGVRQPRGLRRWLSVSASPITVGNRRIVVATHVDITSAVDVGRTLTAGY